MSETPKQSDQLPEEGPAGQVPEDTSRPRADDSPGAPGKERTATGNPDAAGADAGDEEDPAGA